MAKIQIRFNTQYASGDPALKWRVLVDGVEHLVKSVHIKAESFTSEDTLSTGELKWHISCMGQAVITNQHAVIEKP